MANDVIAELGFDKGITNSAYSNRFAQEDGDEKKDEGGDDAKKEGGDEKKEGGDDAKKEGGDDAKKEGGDAKGGESTDSKKAKKKANMKPIVKSATKDEPKDYEAGTPAHILDRPDYMDEVNRLLPEFYQDPALEQATRNSTIPIDQSEITEDKEREGYYPTDLDQEVMGYGNSTVPAYTYGDRVPAYNNHWNNTNWDYRYRSNKYNNIYDPNKREYNPDN